MATTIDELQLNITSNSTKASKEIEKLAESLNKLKDATNPSTITKNLDSLNTKLNDLGNSAKSVSKLSKLKTGISKISNVFKGLAGVMASIGLGNALQNPINSINEYVENLNLFSVSMGKFYDEAKGYAERVESELGIDSSEWMRGQGTFMAMAKGFGMVEEQAYQLSKGMTEMSYDFSSFYNIPITEALTKMRSALAGEIEPLRELGISLTEATLQEFAHAKGITKKVNAMTEAEKTQLRYVAIVEKASEKGMGAIGDLARTIDSPMNALKIMGQQFIQLGRAIGTIFLPVLQFTIPYIQILTNAVTNLAKRLAELLNIKIDEPDKKTSNIANSVSESANALSDATKKAKEYKKSLQGFDELNIIPAQQQTASSGAGVGTGGDLGLDIQSVWSDSIFESINKKTDEIIGKFKELGSVVADTVMVIASIGAGILAWQGITKLAMGIGSGFGIVKSAIETVYLYFLYFVDGVKLGVSAVSGSFLPAVLIITAVASVVYTLYKHWDKVVDVVQGFVKKIKLEDKLKRIKKQVEPLLESVSGLGTIFEFVGGILVTVGGIILSLVAGAFNGLLNMIAPVIKMVKGLIDIFGALGKFLVGVFTGDLNKCKEAVSLIWQGIVDIFFGGIEAVVGFVAGFVQGVIEWFKTMWDVLVGHSIVPDMVDAIINCFKDMIDNVINAVSNFVRNIINFFSDMYNNVVRVASDCLTGIKNVFSTVGNWFSTNVTQPVGNFFSGLWNGIQTTASNSWEGIKNIFSAVGNWMNTYVVSPVSNFFTGMWNGFKNAGSNAWESIKTVFGKVGTFFKDTFTNAWNGVVKVFNVGGQIFTNIKDGILSSFKWVVNQLIKGINNVIAIPFKGINTALNLVKNIKILGMYPFSRISTISVPSIPLLASGGMVDTGQMFIARESGPEMVGTIGGTSAVANNMQIVEGISQGVYEAVMRAMSSSGGNNNFNANITVELDGKQVGKSVVKYHNDVVNQTGLSPLMI